MRLLFTMDAQNYDPAGTKFSRPSVRGVILRDGKLAMVHAREHDFYKFPGGGMEPGEDKLETLIREVREESGMTVIRGSIRPYGRVYRIEKGHPEDVFEQENYYYFCDVEDAVGAQELDAYERREGFTLEWVAPAEVVRRNRALTQDSGYLYWRMAQREARVAEMLEEELAVSN